MTGKLCGSGQIFSFFTSSAVTVSERPRRQACRIHIEEIMGYLESSLYIGWSLQV